MTKKMNPDLLLIEAERYRALARELALQVLLAPNELTARLACDHVVRAETFKTAFQMLSNGN